jgi:hypothetical protein
VAGADGGVAADLAGSLVEDEVAADGEADLGAFGAVPERARLGGEERQR